MPLVEILAALNILVMIGAGWVTISKTNDMMTEFKSASKILDNTVRIIDKRVTVIETICTLNHPATSKELLKVQD